MSGTKDRWTDDRIKAAGTFVIERLAADFEGTGLPVLELRIDPTWNGSDDAPPYPRPDDVILFCGGHEFPLQLQGGAEYACAYAAWMLQDDVTGEHRRPWPELTDADGRFVGVLVPPADGSVGLAQWQLNGQPFCAVGHLHRACGAAGLTIKNLTD